jgi:hypothetical protein
MNIGTGTTIAFDSTLFAEVLDVSPPNLSRNSVETSHMSTDTNHTFMPTDLIDNGEVTLEIAFNPKYDFKASFFAKKVKSCVITFADSGDGIWTFSAFATGYEPSVPLEDRMTATITLKVTGGITIT